MATGNYPGKARTVAELRDDPGDQPDHTAEVAEVVHVTHREEAAGVLQKLQNQLRTADLTDSRQTSAVQALSAEFASVQENLDLLMADGPQTGPKL